MSHIEISHAAKKDVISHAQTNCSTFAIGSISHYNLMTTIYQICHATNTEKRANSFHDGCNFKSQPFCMTIADHICHVTNNEKRASYFTFAMGSFSH